MNRHFITEEDLSKFKKGRNYYENLLKLISVIDSDIMTLRREICKKIKKGDDTWLFIHTYYRLLESIDIDGKNIYDELTSVLVFEDKKVIQSLAIYIEYGINDVINFVLDKEGELIDMSELRNKKYSKDISVDWTMDEMGKYNFDIVKKEKIKIDKSKKKKDKEELRENVNKFDKSYGSRLKHPINMIDDVYEYENMVMTYRILLTRLIFLLNDVNPKNYLKKSELFGKEIKKIKINDDFVENSEWFDEVSYDYKSYKFKARFVTYMINWFQKNLDLIAHRSFYINEDSVFQEYESKTCYVEYVVERLCDFICKVFSGKSFQDDMMYFTELQIFLETEEKDVKKNLKKIENLNNQSFILSKRLTWWTTAEDDVSMDTLLKLAYMVTTTDPKIKGRIEFHEGYKFYNRKETKMMIEELGYAIIHSRKKYEVPHLFRFFVKSDPLLWCKYNDVNENQNLLVGIVALKYLAFVVNDKHITKKVKKLTEF